MQLAPNFLHTSIGPFTYANKELGLALLMPFILSYLFYHYFSCILLQIKKYEILLLKDPHIRQIE